MFLAVNAFISVKTFEVNICFSKDIIFYKMFISVTLAQKTFCRVKKVISAENFWMKNLRVQ